VIWDCLRAALIGRPRSHRPTRTGTRRVEEAPLRASLWRAQKTVPPRTVDQISADAQRMRELEARVADLEREREILQKSTAFFMKRWIAH